MARLRLVLLGLFLPSLVLAQARPPTENVTVTGTKSREVLQNFIGSLAVPTHFIGKLARWEDGVCPVVVGLRSQFTGFIADRLRAVANQAGAPVNKSKSCKPNIEIVFTAGPQALLDNVRKTTPEYLGYYDNEEQLDRLATVTHPIQAWYTTATRDLNGKVEVDNAKIAGIGLPVPCESCPGKVTYLPNAKAFAVTGSRLGDGLRSSLYHVIIVADPNKLLEYEIGELSDYIAMRALSQVGSQDNCEQLPSIVNMLAENCATKSNALTENDKAYLHGLDQMNGDLNLGTQKDQIAYHMEQDLKGR